jgi:hypothetical protein
MNDLSVRGIYRRYLVEPRIAFFGTDDPAIVGDPKNISIAKVLWAQAQAPSNLPAAVGLHGCGSGQ